MSDYITCFESDEKLVKINFRVYFFVLVDSPKYLVLLDLFKDNNTYVFLFQFLTFI